MACMRSRLATRAMLAVFFFCAFVDAASLTITRTRPGQRDKYGDQLPGAAVSRLGTVRLRVGSIIDSVSLSSDGKLIVCADRKKGSLYVFDATSGKRVRVIHDDEFVREVVSCPKKNLFACLTAAGAQIRDVETGAIVRRFQRGGSAVAVALHSEIVALANPKGGVVDLWDFATGKEVRCINVEASPRPESLEQYSLAFCPGTDLIAVGGWS